MVNRILVILLLAGAVWGGLTTSPQLFAEDKVEPAWRSDFSEFVKRAVEHAKSKAA